VFLRVVLTIGVLGGWATLSYYVYAVCGMTLAGLTWDLDDPGLTPAERAQIKRISRNAHIGVLLLTILALAGLALVWGWIAPSVSWTIALLTFGLLGVWLRRVTGTGRAA